MVAKVTTGSGLWTDAIWAPAGTPGAGDTVDVLNTHTVTIDGDVEVGDDTATYAIHVNVGGKLQVLSTVGGNYTLTLVGTFFNDGTVEIGTELNPIPVTRTFTIRLNKSAAPADAKYTWFNQNGSVCTFAGHTHTVWRTFLDGNASIGDGHIHVTDAVDWEVNDEIVIEGTERPATVTSAPQFERKIISGFSTDLKTINLSTNLAYDHKGVVDNASGRAAVYCMTHNIKIRDNDPARATGIGCNSTSRTILSGVEIFYFGSTPGWYRGFDIYITTGSFKMYDVCFHDTKNYCLYATPGCYNLNLQYVLGVQLLSVATPSQYGSFLIYGSPYNVPVHGCTMQHFAAVGAGGPALPWYSGPAFTFAASGGNGISYPIDDVRVSGVVGNSELSSSIQIATQYYSSNLKGGPFTNLESHSCTGGVGITANSASPVDPIIVDGVWSWRHISHGFYGNGTNCIYRNVKVTGSGPNWANIYTSGNHVLYNSRYENFTVGGEVGFPSASGWRADSTGPADYLEMFDSTFGIASGQITAHGTSDLDWNGNYYSQHHVKFHNCQFGGAFWPVGAVYKALNNTYWGNFYFAPNAYLHFLDHQGTPGNWLGFYRCGQMYNDTVIKRVGTTQSVRMQPYMPAYGVLVGQPTLSQELFMSPSKKVAIAAGQTVTVKVWVRESVLADGTDYIGKRIGLYVRRNHEMGYDADTLLASGTIASEGAFEQISGTTIAAPVNGVLEFFLAVGLTTITTATTGWINYQDWSVT